MIRINGWRGSLPKGETAVCNVQEVSLERIEGDEGNLRYVFFTLSWDAQHRPERVFGELTLPATSMGAIYGGLQVFDAHVSVNDDGSVEIHSLVIEGTTYDVRPHATEPVG